MSEPQFTPGPWRWEGVELVCTRMALPVSVLNPLKRGIGLRESDAALIAAAPDLYVALEAAMSVRLGTLKIRDGLKIIEQAHAALARARGETA